MIAGRAPGHPAWHAEAFLRKAGYLATGPVPRFDPLQTPALSVLSAANVPSLLLFFSTPTTYCTSPYTLLSLTRDATPQCPFHRYLGTAATRCEARSWILEILSPKVLWKKTMAQNAAGRATLAIPTPRCTKKLKKRRSAQE